MSARPVRALHDYCHQALNERLLRGAVGPEEMAKKGSSINALKSLFSRSEASLDEPAGGDAENFEKEKRKLKLKFLKFRTKSKKGSASSQAANESQQVLR